MKRIPVLMVAAAAALMFNSGCGNKQGTEYSDIRSYIHAIGDFHKNTAEDLRKVKDAAGTVAAIDRMTGRLVPLAKTGADLAKKYPDIMQPDGSVSVPELKDDIASIEKLRDESEDARRQVEPFMSDPEVQKALIRQRDAVNAIFK